VIERVVTGPIFVRGGPGSGKTLVATYHALDQAQRETLLGKPRVLYLSYTNALVRDASRRIEELCGEIPPNLELNTIDKKARAVGNLHGVVYSGAQLLDYAEQAKTRCARLGYEVSLDADFLVDELQKVLEKHAVSSLEAYLELHRQGRGKALQAAERDVVWRWREQFLAILQEKRLRTRAMAIQDATKRAGTVDNSERYDLVVVDEVQDLGVVDVQLFIALAKFTKGKPHVMFCGDTGQAIYKTGFRWKDAGLQIGGGNVLTLETCERSTKEIMTFAASLGVAESDEEAETIGLPAREGLKPRIVSGFRIKRDLYDFAARHLQQAISSHGKDPAKFAIISRYRKRLEEFNNHIIDGAFPFRVVFQDDRDFFARGSVKLITAHAAKGLEFDSVIVLPADDDCFPAPKHFSGQFADENDWLDAERKLLYVACTRARNVLQLLCGTMQSRFLSSAMDQAVLVGAGRAEP
jgi:superfamily I DNA/RNA helicase